VDSLVDAVYGACNPEEEKFNIKGIKTM